MERLKLDIQRFATSGRLLTSANEDGTTFFLDWNRSSYSVADNTTTIYWVLGINAAYSYYSNAVSCGPVVINGETVYGGGTYSDISKGTHGITAGYLTIHHNNDGTKSFSASISGWTWGCSWVSKTEQFTLDPIKRISKIDNVTCTDSQQRTNNIEGTFNATYTRYNSSFTDNLVIEYLDRSDNSWNTIKTITNYVSGTDFTFTQQELNTLFSYDTTQTMINLKFYLQTYTGQTLIGNSNEQIYTFKIYDNAPVFSDFTFADINTTTTALTGDNSININNYSNIQVTISTSDKAVAQKGATMVKYRFVCGNQSTDIEYSASASVNGTINNTENGTYQVYAIDSRGNSTPVTKLATSVKEYIPITRDTNYSATRDNGGIGGNVTISFSGSIWNNSFGSVSNGFNTAKYLLKKTDSSTWIDLGSLMTNITPTITNNTYSFSGLIRSDNPDTTWDLDSSYDIKIILEDKLSSVEFIMTVASATPNISLSRNGVGIMCDYDETLGGLLQVGGQPYSAGAVGSVTMYAGDNAPTGYLFCDGTAISRTTYSDLFSVIGTTYGTGDGSTTFNLPNLKGKVVVGLDSSDNDFDSLGETGGSKNLQAHTHKINNAGYEGGSSGDALVFKSRLTVVANYMETASTGTGNSGNLQPYMVMNYIIKY